MQEYSNNVPDKAGNALAGVQVLVTINGVNAALFSGNGVTPMANPTTTNDLGVFKFFAANGTYTITLTSSQLAAPIVNTGVILYDPVDAAATIVFRSELASPSGAQSVGFKQSPSATTGSLEKKGREKPSMMDYLTPAQQLDVTSRAGLIDCLPAFYTAISELSEQGTFVYPVADKILLPRGRYFLNGSLALSTAVHFVGVGKGQGGGNYGAQLRFPTDSSGIVGQKGNTGPNTNGSDGSIIEGVYLLGGGGTSTTAHGVDMKSRMKLRDVYVGGFAGNGVNIVADIANRTNANGWIIDTLTTQFNGLNGIYVQGGDSNAGYAHGIDASDNGTWGINDASFLGNTYFGCHTDGNGRRSMVSHLGNRYYCIDESLAGSTVPGTNAAVWVFLSAGGVLSPYYPAWVSATVYLIGGAYAGTGASSRNVFVGCYSEQGSQPPSKMVGNNMVLGGLHAAGFTNAIGGVRLVDGQATRIGTSLTATGGQLTLGADNSNEVLTLTDPTISRAFPYRLKYLTGKWDLDWANVKSWLHLYTRDATTANGFARDLGALNGGIGLPNGYYGGGMKFRGEAAAIPTTGAALQGDFLINTAPVLGGAVGFICTVTGTPGTWQPFGIAGAVRSAAHADSVAATLAALVTDYNGLLAKLRTAGLVA